VGLIVFESIQSADLAILWWLHSCHSPVVIWSAWAVATLAWKGWLWWIVIGYSWFRKRRDLAIHLGSALIIATVAGLPLKGLIARPRPDLFASIQLNVPMPELLSTAHSFPSGHTLLAAAFAGVIWTYYKDYRAWLAFTFVALVGTARVFQGLHWPSDVLGSILLGFLAAWAAGFVLKLKPVQRFLQPPQQKLASEFLVPLNEVIGKSPKNNVHTLSGRR
jgi:undecaprenyl-diphosphatase